MSGKAEGSGQSLSEVSGSAGREAGRPKAFVAFMTSIGVKRVSGEVPLEGKPHWFRIASEPEPLKGFLCDESAVPVVVTPLLPDDPRPGEVWLLQGRKYTVASAPFDYGGSGGPGVALVSEFGQKCWNPARSLSRPPVLKTFRVSPTHADRIYLGTFDIKAESKEAALKLLAASLEEVE